MWYNESACSAMVSWVLSLVRGVALNRRALLSKNLKVWLL